MDSKESLTALLVIGLFIGATEGAVHAQNPGVWDALDKLRGHIAMPVQDIQELFYSVQPGVDFPIYAEVPETGFTCKSVNQPGYYADTETRCQVFRRCDLDSVLTSYLCPNMTLFNQITLICDWWYNVDCAQSKQFYDYTNTRLYQGEDVTLLDNQDNYVVNVDAAAAGGSYVNPVPAPGRRTGGGSRVSVRGEARSRSQSSRQSQQQVLSSQDIYNAQGNDQPQPEQPVRRKKHRRNKTYQQQ